MADLLLLFPGVSALPDGLNIITLSQHTVNDMTAWSVEVEKERDQLLEHVSMSLTYCAGVYWGGGGGGYSPPPPKGSCSPSQRKFSVKL